VWERARERGWTLVAQGDGEAEIVQMRQGLAAYRVSGAVESQTYMLALLAEAYGKVGQVEEGLAAVAEALEFVDRTGERYYEAELYRLRGELTLAQSSVQRLESSVQNPQSAIRIPQLEAEAEACFLKAIEIARRQQAKSLELRAATSRRGCGNNKASGKTRVRCWWRSTTGLLKALIPRTCKKPRRCWKSYQGKE
jgi:tetratricopeptide (TPR) repeat protein